MSDTETTDSALTDFKMAIAEIGPTDPEEVARAAKVESKLERIRAAVLRHSGPKLERLWEILVIDLSEENLPTDTTVRINLDDDAPSGRVIVIRCEGGDD